MKTQNERTISTLLAHKSNSYSFKAGNDKTIIDSNGNFVIYDKDSGNESDRAVKFAGKLSQTQLLALASTRLYEISNKSADKLESYFKSGYIDQPADFEKDISEAELVPKVIKIIPAKNKIELSQSEIISLNLIHKLPKSTQNLITKAINSSSKVSQKELAIKKLLCISKVKLLSEKPGIDVFDIVIHAENWAKTFKLLKNNENLTILSDVVPNSSNPLLFEMTIKQTSTK